jgi:hypothetical protein
MASRRDHAAVSASFDRCRDVEDMQSSSEGREEQKERSQQNGRGCREDVGGPVMRVTRITCRSDKHASTGLAEP